MLQRNVKKQQNEDKYLRYNKNNKKSLSKVKLSLFIDTIELFCWFVCNHEVGFY